MKKPFRKRQRKDDSAENEGLRLNRPKLFFEYVEGPILKTYQHERHRLQQQLMEKIIIESDDEKVLQQKTNGVI